MKLRIGHFTILLLLPFILLAGCNGCQEKQEKRVVAPPLETSARVAEELANVVSDLQSIDENDQREPIQPPIVPDDFLGDPYFYIPNISYQKLVTMNGDDSGSFSVPVVPDDIVAKLHDIYEWRAKNLGSSFTFDKTRVRVEIMVRGLSPLDAAKFLHLDGHYPKFAMEYAQQAIDENPDDYTRLYVWTYVQEDLTLKERGLRSLLSMNPRSPKLNLDLGFYLVHSDREQEGIDYMKKSVVLDPSYKRAAALGALGRFYQFSEADLALAYYKEAQRYYVSSSRQRVIDILEKGERP